MTRTASETEAQEVISAGRIGRLGCIVKGEPYVVPIHYLCENGSIYSHSLPGRKIRALRVQPRACLQVDEIESELRWRSAIAFGDFEEIHDDLERAQILRKLLTRFPLLTPVESSVVQNSSPPEIVVFRLRIDRVTGVAEE
jgi:nitroimidazol reductase NimA-like FMN-containing flavoprotein (pyridoxamine 5'-phosphate oxidase superfamily)